ncbi:gluzincin family metallopeptidase [Tenacibaculum maritimum]|uniref:aminopeptidase n=2 Tax=Tenacibaculum maritimum TaxID=107401 RepID=UPI0038764CF7
MTTKKLFSLVITLLCYLTSIAQENNMNLNAYLDTKKEVLKIQQTIVFFNKTSIPHNTIFLHNWSNSYKNNNTPLAKRFINDYSHAFYFSKEQERGSTTIHNLTVDHAPVSFTELKGHQDIIKILLNQPLVPNDSIKIILTYTQKIPSARFTGYGKTKTGYHLRFWYFSPAIYHQNQWQLMSNLNMDDLYMDIANYSIEIVTPKKYLLESNLYKYLTKNKHQNNYFLIGQQKKDIIINIDSIQRFKTFKTKKISVKTDIFNPEISSQNTSKIINKGIRFIEQFLGKYPHKELFIDRNTINKNTIHSVFKIPKFLKPFPENFQWEIEFFQALSTKYLENILLLNKRKDYWFIDGLQTFLMMEYINQHYPDLKILGKYANIWGVKTLHLSKLRYNDKYPFVYQFSARKFYDQALTTPADSLSNFNRKIVSKYKAGLGFKYLQSFIGDSILKKSLKLFYSKEHLKISNSQKFAQILQSKTTKDLQWFFGDYLHTTKKIDYKIKKVIPIFNEDSLLVTIKNKRNITAPIMLYGIKNKRIKFKQWITGVDTTKTFKIYKGNFNKLVLNYEQIYPEHNLLNNWKNINTRLLNKPIQFKLLKDIEDPYYNQIFLSPNFKYNFYDGFILGARFHNKPILARNFEFSLAPNYGFKSTSLTGGFSMGYNQYFEKSNIYKIRYGLSGSNYHYTQNLAYNSFTPFMSIQFKRNSLRDVGSKSLTARLIHINKEIPFDATPKESDRYNILNFRYIYNKPDIIRRFQYAINLEFANDFSKISTDIRYRKQISLNRSLDLRFYGGIFLQNNTKSNYFSFGLGRGSDYLFEQNLFGRSESSGIFSQQYVISDGGFKSSFSNNMANQFLFSTNTSIGIWHWVEFYNDFATYKNSGQKINFAYENGVRLNFIPNILEFYFPLYTNQGWEIKQYAYPTKIRFVITTNISAIYNFIRRGFL